MVRRARRLAFLGLVLCLAMVGCASEAADAPRAPDPSSPSTPASEPDAAASPSPDGSPSPTVSPSPTAPSGPVWRRAIGFSWPQAIATDGEGNVYVTGSEEVGRAQVWGRQLAMVLERSDPEGRQVWIRRWKSSDEMYMNATGSDVAVSPDGSLVYVAGEVSDEAGENRRVQVWAISPEGDLRWTNAAPAIAFGAAVAASDTGVVVGSYGRLTAWGKDGTVLWTREFEEPTGEHCDVVADLAIADDGTIYAVGALDLTPTCNDTEGGPAYSDADIVIQKRSASGVLRWSRVFTDPGADIDRALAVDVAGRGVFVTGEEDGRAWIARLSPKGRAAWTDRWSRTGSGAFGVDVSVSPWGAVYVLGDRRPLDGPGTLHLRRYTPAGELEWGWTRALPAGADVSGVATAPDDALYVMTSDCQARCPLWRLPA